MNPLVASETFPAAPTALSVNLNRVALLRNSRPLNLPDLSHIAALVLQAGAQGLTVHPRPDERHVRARDVHDLAALVNRWPHAEFNIEGNPFHNLLPLVEATRPAQATFVPDAVGQATSDHGWDLRKDLSRLAPLITQVQGWGVRVSLFMDPQPEDMVLARDAGADRVELYTEAYARAHGTAHQPEVSSRYTRTAEAAAALGLGVNAGHDLNRRNLTDFLRAVPNVREVSIGHALAADALELGYPQAVREYLHCIWRAYR